MLCWVILRLLVSLQILVTELGDPLIACTRSLRANKNGLVAMMLYLRHRSSMLKSRCFMFGVFGSVIWFGKCRVCSLVIVGIVG